ncbi:MAG: FAD:protein FMN transferase [Elusimicrobiota bacterium]
MPENNSNIDSVAFKEKAVKMNIFNSIIRKKTYILVFSLLIIISSYLFFKYRNGSNSGVYEETRLMMGTHFSIKVDGDGNASDLIDKAFESMEEIYKKFSHIDQSSPVYQFNNHSVPIEEREIVNLVERALLINQKSRGAFDITVYPLIKLWDYDKENPSIPEKDEVETNLKAVGGDKVKISKGKVVKSRDEVEIVFGAIAKGYAVDAAAETLRAKKVQSALIDAGGDIYALGKFSGRKWRVGIRHPRDGSIMDIVEVSDLAVVTSGDYENYFYYKGKRYNHIIDPRTGFPSDELASVTVISPSAASADAWATAFFVMGTDNALEKAEKLAGVECMLVTPDMKVHKSSGFDKYLKKE